METYYYQQIKDRYLILESWVWGLIFVVVPLYGIFNVFNAEPWVTITTVTFATLVTGALLIKVVKMRALRNSRRAVLYGSLFVLSMILFFFPWNLLW
ncbi:hypothetical protein [Alkalicoccobacillus murimartini]|uniref:Uncharacterized protein n=1 Tax=Alkalicoccobacillus murimartini TaxID=171685 RepID=A0ABT9YI58_9BACI|nr:hypothetical protein [Alkalicoccobacillus murimartini]MDQ0207283.1 hypothetical protein [Alkalicoccobacillus murimartini]